MKVAQSIKSGRVTVEVQHLLGDATFRGVSMSPTEGLSCWQPSDEAIQGTFTVFLGANRGRGQAYPNGAASNLVSCRWDDLGVVPGRCFLAKRLGVSPLKVVDVRLDESSTSLESL